MNKVELGSLVTFSQQYHEGRESRFKRRMANECREKETLPAKSPVGQAIMGLEEGSSVEVEVPGGKCEVTILKVE